MNRSVETSGDLSFEWIWVARLLSAIAFASAGIMRLTLSSTELAERGDWTLGRLPLPLTGSLLLVTALALMLPRRGRFLYVSAWAGLMLTGFEVASLGFLFSGGDVDWHFDGARLLLVAVVCGDALFQIVRRLRSVRKLVPDRAKGLVVDEPGGAIAGGYRQKR